MKEILLGFDAREMSQSYQDHWEASRKSTFLLQHNIDKPLSVDTRVWNSIIDEALALDLPKNYSWIHNLWLDLEKLREFLPSQASPYWEIAVTQFFDEATIQETGVDVMPVNPKTIQGDWILLGYDVAEETLLSGLLNMGYTDNDKLYSIQNFALALNQYHLFTSYDIAQQFAIWNQSRDAGHGPWYVTGLYQIPNNIRA